jgi:hypothetical protein
MGFPSSSLPAAAAAAALVLLALLAGGGECREAQFDATDAAGAGAENFNTSDAAVYWGPWQKARATWYGQPNGAGPDDNGERIHRHSFPDLPSFPSRRPLLVLGAFVVVGGNVAHETNVPCFA